MVSLWQQGDVRCHDFVLFEVFPSFGLATPVDFFPVQVLRHHSGLPVYGISCNITIVYNLSTA